MMGYVGLLEALQMGHVGTIQSPYTEYEASCMTLSTLIFRNPDILAYEFNAPCLSKLK